MPVRQALAILRFLLLAILCFAGAYYFGPRRVAPAAEAAPIAIIYTAAPTLLTS